MNPHAVTTEYTAQTIRLSDCPSQQNLPADLQDRQTRTLQ